LAQLVGTQLDNTIGNSYEYISQYAQRLKKSVAIAVLSVVSEIEKVLDLILQDTPASQQYTEIEK
jgi:transcriptional regulator of met regulon